jgi:imidazolonepropionase-like amidohydrolase
MSLVAAHGDAATPTETVAIVGATVFDATGAAPHAATVVIKDGRIADVGPRVAIPKGAKVIHAEGEALLPGFFDVHTHWTPGGQPRTTPQIANAYVAAGVTTVDDFNAAPESFEPRRRWLSTLATPHVNFTARMSLAGGHGADWADTATTKWVGAPEAARFEVRALLPYKPDLIKAFQDGWRYGSGVENNSMDLVTLSALVDEAHKNNIKVLTHTVTVARGKDAARAKVDVIAHSLQDAEIDQETIDLMKANGTAYAPTLAVYEPVKPGQAAPADPEDPRLKQSRRKFAYALHNVKALQDAGVVVALGTDAGMPGTPHGTSSLREMELLVQAGLTPTQALLAGTANSAKVLGLLSDRGTIEKGKRADLVLLKGAPWTSIGDVRKTDRVFIDGRLVQGPGVVPLAANTVTAMPATPAKALIDDFERPDGRSNLDTLLTDDVDGGQDRSVQVTTIVSRTASDHALSVAAKMSRKDAPSAGVIIPLNRGSIQPVDVKAFKGVRFEIRGDGDYGFGVNTPNGQWSTEVKAGPDWRKVEVPFDSLKKPKPRGGGEASWKGDDLVEVEFEASRPAGQKVWMEIDNVEFY